MLRTGDGLTLVSVPTTLVDFIGVARVSPPRRAYIREISGSTEKGGRRDARFALVTGRGGRVNRRCQPFERLVKTIGGAAATLYEHAPRARCLPRQTKGRAKEKTPRDKERQQAWRENARVTRELINDFAAAGNNHSPFIFLRHLTHPIDGS